MDREASRFATSALEIRACKPPAAGVPYRPASLAPRASGCTRRSWRLWEANLDIKTKEYAMEYGLILGVGAALLVFVFLNLHFRFLG
jgi:hypothetical protein